MDTTENTKVTKCSECPHFSVTPYRAMFYERGVEGHCALGCFNQDMRGFKGDRKCCNKEINKKKLGA